MAGTTIGLHIYAVKMHYERKHKTIKLSTSGDGAALANYSPQFFQTFAQQIGGATGSARSWYLEPKPKIGSSYHGIVRYGSTGFSEEIRDRKTRKIQYNRLPTDIGTIPLYYRLWVPDKGDYALLGIQTFGSRSCVERFKEAFLKGFRAKNEKIMLTFSAVMPTQIAKFKNGPVKTFSLTKKDYSSDKADNQFGPQGDLVDLDVTFKAKPKGSLGTLSSFSDKVKGTGKDKVLEYNDTHFDEATALVQVGKKTRKVVLVGVSKNSGKFDLTEDVQTTGGHPKFDSIAKECEDLFTSIVAG